MDKRTRLLNAMDCKPVDRVPVTFYTHCMTKEDLEDNAVSAQLKWYHDCNMDFLCIEPDGYMEYRKGVPVQNLADWKDLKGFSRNDRYFTGQLDRAARITEGIKDGGCTYYMVFTPFTTIKHTIGGETRIMELYRENRDILTEAMKVIEENTFLLCDLLMRETGITGIFVALQNGEDWRFSKEEYEEYLSPWDRRLLAHANSLSDYNITHLCSWTGVPNNLELWKNYDYKTVNWSAGIEKDMDLRQARSFFKPNTALMGGFDNTPNGILYLGDEKQIKEHTAAQLTLAGQTGTILCGDCSVQTDQDPKKVRYVIEACEEYAVNHRR